MLPEVGNETGAWVLGSPERCGARVHLNTRLVSAEHGHVVLSDGEEFGSTLIVWTAGNAANPVVHNQADLPVDGRGLLTVRRLGTTLRLVALYRAAYALTTYDLFSPDSSDGHFQWRAPLPNRQTVTDWSTWPIDHDGAPSQQTAPTPKRRSR